MIDELKQWEYDKGYEKGNADTLKVIEDIKADIEKQVEFFNCMSDIGNNLLDDVHAKGLKHALKIIDYHLKGEDKE